MQKIASAYFIDLSEVRDMVDGYLSRPTTPVAYDLETTGFDPHSCKLVSMQLRQFARPSIIIDLRNWSFENLLQLGNTLRPLFDNQLIVGMNIKFDWAWTKVQLGVDIRRVYDVMLAEQCIRGLGVSSAKKIGISFNLKGIAEQYGLEVSKQEREVFPDMDSKPEWYQPFSPELVDYMAQDVEVLEKIYNAQQFLIDERQVRSGVDLDNGVVPAVADMEVNGIWVEQTGWRAFMAKKAEQARDYETQITDSFGSIIIQSRLIKHRQDCAVRQAYDEALKANLEKVTADYASIIPVFGEKVPTWGAYKREKMAQWREENPNPGVPKLDERPMNLSSSAQMLTCLQTIGVMIEQTEWNPKTRKVETEEIPINSTSAKVLDNLVEGEFPEVDMFKVWRKTNKFVTSFGESLLAKINAVTGRLHSRYFIDGADTSRMSCTDPNFQQIPGKGDGKRLRSLVQAMRGNLMLTADFSNIELRILADISGDENMLRFFAEEKDLHCETARMMFGLSDMLTKEEIEHLVHPLGFEYRAAAKTINFGLVYGMSSKRLAAALKISKAEAESLMKAYFRMYPGVAMWLEEQAKYGVENLKSRTIGGHARFYTLPPVSDPDYRRLRGSLERRAKNTPIQGSSADITKLALALFYQRAPAYAKLVACVHDELVVECPRQHAQYISKVLGDAMDDAGTYYLKHVAWKPTKVNISEAWEKA